VTGATGKQELDISTNGTTFKVKNVDMDNLQNNNGLFWSNPYISNAAGYSVWLVYAKTDRGTVCFYVDEVFGDTTPGYYVGGMTADNKIDDTAAKVVAYSIHDNMSIAQESPWLSFFINLIPTLLLLGIMF
jgi:hypothetical protein